MSGRQKAGGVMMVVDYLAHLGAGLLALGSMFNGCVAVSRGYFAEFIFSVGLAVFIGWIGQFLGGPIMAGGAAVGGE